MSGFSTDLFCEEIKEDFLCPVCLCVFNDPRQCLNGHCLCKECLKESLKLRMCCSLCQVAQSIESSGQNLVVKNLIGLLQTYCPSKFEISGAGCDWRGPFAERQTHFEKYCLYRTVECVCGEKMYAFIFHSQHFYLCKCRPVDCEYCRNKFQFSLEESHNILCPSYSVACTNSCGLTMRQDELRDHLDNECPLQVLECLLFKGIGCHDCKGTLLRKDLNSHMTSVPRLTSVIDQLIQENQKLIKEAKASIKPKVTSPLVGPLGTKVEYLNKKGKWLEGYIIRKDESCDDERFIVRNLYDFEASFDVDKLRLVQGSEMGVGRVRSARGHDIINSLMYSGCGVSVVDGETYYQMMTRIDLDDICLEEYRLVGLGMKDMFFLTSVNIHLVEHISIDTYCGID